jgi:hypothetical protein
MLLDYVKILVPVSCFTLNVVLQVLCLRFFSGIGLLRSIYIGFSLGLLLLSYLGLCTFFYFNISLLAYQGLFLTSLVTYTALGYSYFHFLNLGETARRIRILRELYDAKEGLSYAQLLQRYNTRMIIDVRMKRLIDSHQIDFINGRYYIRDFLVLNFARMVVRMKKLLFGKNYQSFV